MYTNDIKNIELKKFYSSIITELHKGVIKGKHPFHLFVYGSIENGNPENRTVVFRKFNDLEFIINFHTDYRSSKIVNGNEKNVSLLFYSKESSLQLRMKGISNVHYNDEITKESWSRTKEMSKECYTNTIKPGEVIENNKDYLYSGDADKKDEIAFKNFSVVRVHVNYIDALKLAHDGHIRAKFDLIDKKITGNWVSP